MADLSDFLAPALQIGSTILSAGSQIARGTAMEGIGARRKALSDYEAAQLEQQAGQERSIGMAGAQNATLKTQLINSKALAIAAASGGGAADPSVLDVMAKTAAEGAYRQSLALYEGESAARLDLMRATAARYEGETSVSDAAAAKKASEIGAASTFLTGGVKVLTMKDMYWSGDGIG